MGILTAKRIEKSYHKSNGRRTWGFFKCIHNAVQAFKARI
jgi:hypothetical protein